MAHNAAELIHAPEPLSFVAASEAGYQRVKALVEISALDHHNVIGLEIHGQVWAQPGPIELTIRTEIDLETGKGQLADLAPYRVG